MASKPGSTTAAKPKKPPKPKPKPEAAPEPEVPEETPWATHDDLPMRAYRDIDLPVAQRKVRVRYLTNIEIAALGLLPDLQNWSSLMLKAMSSQTTPSPDEQATILKERVGYIERVAHLCVMPMGVRGVVKCDCDLAPHEPTLWSREQVKYLDQLDLSLITQAAERMEVLDRVRPLLAALTDEGSPEPATSGESIPLTNSSEETPPS